jgi:hypothetical protein
LTKEISFLLGLSGQSASGPQSLSLSDTLEANT